MRSAARRQNLPASCRARPSRSRSSTGRGNGEIYATVAATRLLWALGFDADAIYPVIVDCRGCPARLGGAARGPVHRFDYAAIERPHPGVPLRSAARVGWAWPDLDRIDPAAGGAPVAQRDALKLLAALLQHTDNKAEQQELVCVGQPADDAAPCRRPVMFLHDVGKTFGQANLFNAARLASVNLTAWTAAPVWKDRAQCVANLPRAFTGSLDYPRISEGGRSFLGGLLARLTDAQLRDLFTVARFAERDGTVEAWVSGFRQKRAEIAETRCP